LVGVLVVSDALKFDQSICPKCGGVAVADFVDIGVGMQQSGPFGCEWCGWCEESPNNLFEMSDEDDLL
jgi:ribosomal protein S27AE